MPESPLKRLSALLFALLLLPSAVLAQGAAGPAAPPFTSLQRMSAAQLNAALGAPTITGGTIDGSIIGATNAQAGRFTTVTALSNILQSAGTFSSIGSGDFTVGDNTARKRAQFNSFASPVAGHLSPVFHVQGNAFGTIVTPTGSTPANLRSFTINSDSLTGKQVNGHYFQHTISAGSTHGRNALWSYLNHEGASTAMANQYYVALAGWAASTASAGGTAGTKMGNLFGSNISAELRGGAGLYWNQVVGLEINTGTRTGTEALDKIGLQIVQWAEDAAPASRSEIGLLFGAQSEGGQPTGWKTGIAFGANHATWPMHPDGALMALGEQNTILTARYPMVVARGIDFATVPAKFTASAFASPGFRVDGAGQVALGPNTIGWSSAGLSIGAAGKVGAVSSIAAGGTGFRATDIVRDASGGVYEVATVSGGAITGLTVIKAPTIASGSAPSNPRAIAGGMGSGATVNLAWTDANVVAIGSGRLRNSFAALSGAGTTQGGATLLTASFVRATASAGNDAFRLWPAIAGDSIRILVAGATTIQVFPASGEEIVWEGTGALGADSEITGGAGTELLFRSMENGKWHGSITGFTP